MGDAIVILAAGASTRFGSPKQLADWRGKPLVRFVAEEALATGRPVLVVEGAHRLGAALQGLEVQVVHAERWSAGPGASIKAALGALPAGTTGALVTLVDLPRVTRETLDRLLATPGPLVAAAYAGTVGAPAVFRGEFLERLKMLADDRGAKSLLRASLAAVAAVECPEAGFDVDDPEALARLG